MENEVIDQNDYSLNDGEKKPSPWKMAAFIGAIVSLISSAFIKTK